MFWVSQYQEKLDIPSKTTLCNYLHLSWFPNGWEFKEEEEEEEEEKEHAEILEEK